MTDKPWLSHYDEGVAGTLVYPAIPLQALLTNSAQKFPDHICLHYFDHRFTYEQVVQLSRRVAFALQNIGLQQGQSVGLVLPNIPQFVFAYFGVLIAGGVVVPLNPVYTLTELEGSVNKQKFSGLLDGNHVKKFCSS